MFFKNRVLPAAAIVVVTFACILLGRVVRVAFFAALALASVYELTRVLKNVDVNFQYVVPGCYIVGQAALVLARADAVWILTWFALMAFACLCRVILRPALGAKAAVWTLFGMLWPFFFYGIVMALAGTEKAAVILTLGILSTWACDSMALTVGRAMGKHKLAPTVSPHKTWEGAIGGALFSVAAGALLHLILKGFGGPGVLCCMATALIASSFGQVGDLAASLIKRMCDVKDYSRLLGEHGGIMDKMDSMLFSLPVCWVCLYAFGWL